MRRPPISCGLAPRIALVASLALAFVGAPGCSPPVSEYEERGDRYSAAGQVVDARVEYELALAEAGESPPVELRMKAAALALRSKNFSEANRRFEALLEDEPDVTESVEALYELHAHRWVATGDTFAALQAIEWLRGRDPAMDLGALYFTLGDAAFGRPDYDAAIEAYLLGLARVPGEAPSVVYARLGDAFERRRNCPAAITYFGRFLESDPANAEVVRESRYRMGQCAFRLAERAFAADDWRTARGYLEQVIEVGEPVSRLDDAALLLARIHEREGDREGAMSRYRAIVERSEGRQTRAALEAFRRLKQLEFGLPLQTEERVQEERERAASRGARQDDR